MTSLDDLRRELAELLAANANAKVWGAAVGARHERIVAIQKLLDAAPEYDLRVGPEDVGRTVIYHGYSKTQEGIITSYNDKYVFVRFGQTWTPQACRRDTLEYAHS